MNALSHQRASLQPDLRRLREAMVKNQLEARGIRSQAVLAAMRNVPRHLFVQKALAPHAYDATPLPIGYGQTISQPYMVAKISELLEVSPGMRILEIGSGCGYQAAVLATMGCSVFGIEIVREIFAQAVARLRTMGFYQVQLHRGDGTLGMAQAAPFDRIVVSAGGPKIPPPLIAQLANNGVMIIPVGKTQRQQRLLRVRKTNGAVRTEDLGGAVFVDLVGNHGW